MYAIYMEGLAETILIRPQDFFYFFFLQHDFWKLKTISIYTFFSNLHL